MNTTDRQFMMTSRPIRIWTADRGRIKAVMRRVAGTVVGANQEDREQAKRGTPVRQEGGRQ